MAWLDESGSNQAIDPGTYILSAAICDEPYAQAVREAIRGLLVTRRHRKLHWRDEDPGRQETIAKTIAGLRVEHLVVVRSEPTAAGRPERQRRLCMERMLAELVNMGVGQAILESRGHKDDQRDHRTLDYLRRKRILDGSLHMDHVGGPAEPILWIADACCGAVTQMRCGDRRCYSLIESKVTLVEV